MRSAHIHALQHGGPTSLGLSGAHLVGVGNSRCSPVVGLGSCDWTSPLDCVVDAVDLVVSEAKTLLNEIEKLPDEFIRLVPEAFAVLSDVIAVFSHLDHPQAAWDRFKQLVKDVGTFAFDTIDALSDVAALELPYGFWAARLLGVWPPQPTPQALAKAAFTAIVNGDIQGAKAQLEGCARQLEDMAGFVPGLGTGVAEALGVALAIIDGNGPLGVALLLLIDLPPFVYLPPIIKDVLRALIAAIAELFQGDTVEDIALSIIRKSIIDQIPAGMSDDIKSIATDFFDAMVQVILRGKPLKDVGYQLALKTVQRAIGPAVESVKGTVDQVLADAQQDVRDQVHKLLEDLPPDITDRLEAIAVNLPGPLQNKVRDLKSKVDSIVSPFIDLLNNLSSFRKFNAVAQRNYVTTASVRAVNGVLPPKSQQELVAIRDAALRVTTNDTGAWHTIQEAQLTLLSYGATETIGCGGPSIDVGTLIKIGGMFGAMPEPAPGSGSAPCKPRVVLLARTLDDHMIDAFYSDPGLAAFGLLWYLAFLNTRDPKLPTDKAYLDTMLSTFLKVQGKGLYPPDIGTGQCGAGTVCEMLQIAVDKTKAQIVKASGPIKPLPGDIIRVGGVFKLVPTNASGGRKMSFGTKVVVGTGVAAAAAAGGLYYYARRNKMPMKQAAKSLVQTRQRQYIAAGAALAAGAIVFALAKTTSPPAPVVQTAIAIRPATKLMQLTQVMPMQPTQQLFAVSTGMSTGTKFVIGIGIVSAAATGALYWYARRHDESMKQAASNLWQSTKTSAKKLIPRRGARENPVYEGPLTDYPIPTEMGPLRPYLGGRPARHALPSRPRELAFRVKLDREPYYGSVVLQPDGSAVLYRFMRAIVRFKPGKYQLSKIRSGYGSILIDSNQILETFVTDC